MTETIYKEKREEIERAAADIIRDSINNILKEKDYAVLAVPGGRSVPGIFRLLKDEEIDWSRVHLFMVDERLVPLDDEQSNFRLAKESFIDAIINSGKLPKENVHPFIYSKEKADHGLEGYEAEIKKFGGAYDIVLLSSGEDGHIGALYPNHNSIENKSELYIMMHDSPKPPPDRMSMSRKLLLKAKVAVILFLGEGKRDALNKFRDESVDYKSCPAKLVNEIEKSYALTDIN